jgi:uncharacterized protein (UPF0264 family)
MQLLVSVTSAMDAVAAVTGGADLIDAKDPAAGALGAVSLDRFREVAAAVRGARLLSAALGDAGDEATVANTARAFVAAGAAFVKIGFAGVSSARRVAELIAAVVDGVRGPHSHAAVVAVAYADADRARGIAREPLVEVAARAGARGVLLDTYDKKQGGLFSLAQPRDVAAWTAAAHEAKLIVALAGKLQAADLPLVRDAGADIAGIRGAACEGGRMGQVTIDRVRLLRSQATSRTAWCSAAV